jgi:carbamoyl-phosphate synthase large subunit
MRLLIPTAGNRSVLLEAFGAQPSVQRVVSTEIDPLAPGAQFADRCYAVPRSADPQFIPALISICGQEDIDWLVPLADLDVIRFAEEASRFEQVGVRTWHAPPKTIELSMDKWRTWQLFDELNIDQPRTCRLSDAAGVDAMDLPTYLKPRHAGMKNSPRYFFTPIQNEAELDYFRNRLADEQDDYLLQEPLISGREINVDFFVQDGQLKRLVTLYRLKAGDGGGIIRGKTIPVDPRVRRVVDKLVEAVPFHGASNIQMFEMPDGRLLTTEINPRFSNSSALVVRPAGVDFFDLTIRMMKDETIEPSFDDFRMLAVTSAYAPMVLEDPQLAQIGGAV